MTQQEVYDRIETYWRENNTRFTKRFNRYHNNMARAEDIVQEAFLRALKFWERAPEPMEEFVRWFNQIMNNASKDNNREEMHHGAIDKEAEQVASPETTIPEVIKNEVMLLIEQQAPSHAIILKMAFLNGNTSKEIAQVVPQKASNIRTIIHEFRKDIKERYRWGI